MNGVSRVVVVAGGNTSERAVSLQGGSAVKAALDSKGVNTAWLDPAECDVAEFDWKTGDVAFLVLHGAYGEDGQIQRWLEDRQIPFTGSDSRSSRLAFAKAATKERLRSVDIPTPAAAMIHRSDSRESIRDRARMLQYPLVVKPNEQGSSIGVTVVFEEAQLWSALPKCFATDEFGLMESFIEGSEWTVGLWNNQPLPPICIETPRGFYDYEAKYTDDQTQYLFETDTEPAVLESLKRLAARVGHAIGTSGIARVDFRLDSQNRPWVLEVNTIPGMTDHSLIPKAFAKLGISFPDLCCKIVEETAAPQTHRRSA